MKRVLFVCTENANRSQMAEAFARIHGRGVIDPASAGSAPSGQVNPRAIDAMRAHGYDLATHRSKSTAEVGDQTWDLLVTMGCGDTCPTLPARAREDWDLADPRAMSPTAFNVVRDEIEQRVRGLVERFAGGIDTSPKMTPDA